MKSRMMNKVCVSIIMGMCSFGAPDLTAAITGFETAEECTKELLLSYFPAPIVMETLQRFDIPKNKWDDIVKSLSNKDKEVVKKVEEKAASMNPNPLKDPQQRQAAVKLFRDTLLQVFAESMEENGIRDSAKFQAMLDDIQQQKAKKFAMCMEKRRQQDSVSDRLAQDNNTGDQDDDDDDDSDDDEDDNDDDNDLDDDNKTIPTYRKSNTGNW